MAERLLLIGTGSRTYREYLLRDVARDFDVWLLSDKEASWETPYLGNHIHLDTTDIDAMVEIGRKAAPDGVLTWDDMRVVQAARLAQALGLAGSPPEAVLCCRDKHATRTALRAAGVPQAASFLASTLGEARAAAAETGFPLVLKPRALAASLGVVRVDSPDQLAARFRVARGADTPGACDVAAGDVLVEEYLDGPEISVDTAWHGSQAAVAFVARKQLGFPPYFEEIGHLVDGNDPLASDAELRDLLVAAHAAIGFHTGWTHTEVRYTEAGPKVVEINARLGGDRIPEVAHLALGISAAPIAARIACGGTPVIAPTRRRVAAVRFVYPEYNVVAKGVRIDHERLPASVEAAEPIAVPGQELRLPPDGHVSSRYALILATADTVGQCLADLDRASDAVHVEVLRPLPAGR